MSISALSPPAGPRSVPRHRHRFGAAILARSLLDIGIALAGAAALAYLLVGPFDLGVASVSGWSKPFLQVLGLTSLRLALRGDSALTAVVAAARTRVGAGLARASTAGPVGRASFNAACALVASQLAVKAVGFAARLAYPEYIPRSFEMPFAAARFAETFAAWDSAWYADIALHGYRFDAGAQSSIAFFPLYPLLMRLCAWPFGGTERAVWISGVAITYVALFVALVLLHRLTERVTGDREAARRAQLYLCVFPFAFAFTQVYTEALFLAVSLGAVWCAVTGRWSLAGVCGALAALTRPNGILIALPLVLLAVQDRPSLRTLAGRGVPLALVPLGLASFCVFAYSLSGDPLAWLNAQAQWGYSIGHLPWATVQRLIESIEAQGMYGYLVGEPHALYALSHTSIGLLVVALTPSIFARLGVAFGAYVAVSILIPLSANAIEGIGRYGSTLFPLFMYLGLQTRSIRRHEALVIGSACWLALNVGLFVTQRPVY